MASPFTIGNFNGWTFDSYAVTQPLTKLIVGTTAPDKFEWWMEGVPIHATTPRLTGAFAPGDLINIQWGATVGGPGKVECLATDGSVLASVITTLVQDAPSVTTVLGVPSGTDKARISFGNVGDGGIVTISSMEIPGLVADSTGMMSLADGIPADWTFSTTPPDAGGQSFTRVTEFDSGDGGGSIMVDSQSGGSGWLLPGAQPFLPNKMYTLRARASIGGWAGSANCWALMPEGGLEQLVGISGLKATGEWASFGFKAIAGMVGLRVDVGGPPNSPIYLDAFDFPRMSETAHASASLSPAAPHVVSTGTTGGVGGGNLTPGMGTVSGYGGASAHLAVSCPTLYAQGHDSTGENAAYLSAPRPTLNAYCGASAALTSPKPALSITATITNFGAVALRAPAGLVSAAGTVSGTATASLNAPMTMLAGYSGAVCSLTPTGSPTVLASGTTGGVGGADIRSPSPRLAAGGTDQGYGSANLLAPAGHLGATARAWLTASSPMLTATGHAVVAATYEAYAINLNHTPKPGVEPVDETTRYSRFPFTHIVRHKNSYYGVAADGLYLLGGTTDNGVPTPYAVKTATTDFKSPYQKTVASAYLGGRLGPGATVTLHAGEGAQSQAYPYTTPRGALAQNYRQVFGKGIRHHRYYALGLSGTDVLELDNIELDTHQMTRRI